MRIHRAAARLTFDALNEFLAERFPASGVSISPAPELAGGNYSAGGALQVQWRHRLGPIPLPHMPPINLQVAAIHPDGVELAYWSPELSPAAASELVRALAGQLPGLELKNGTIAIQTGAIGRALGVGFQLDSVKVDGQGIEVHVQNLSFPLSMAVPAAET